MCPSRGIPLLGNSPSRCQRQRKHRDVIGARTPQRTGGGRHRCSGGHDVVDEYDPTALDPASPVFTHGKGTAHVLLAVATAEANL